MARNRGIMSEKLKEEIAKELGVYNIVKNQGWGDVTSRDCGNMVLTLSVNVPKTLKSSHFSSLKCANCTHTYPLPCKSLRFFNG